MSVKAVRKTLVKLTQGLIFTIKMIFHKFWRKKKLFDDLKMGFFGRKCVFISFQVFRNEDFIIAFVLLRWLVVVMKRFWA